MASAADLGPSHFTMAASRRVFAVLIFKPQAFIREHADGLQQGQMFGNLEGDPLNVASGLPNTSRPFVYSIVSSIDC